MHMFHLTKKENEESILEQGLLCNQEPKFTKPYLWTVEFYMKNPVFLAYENAFILNFIKENSDTELSLFKINIQNYQLTADIAGFIDLGAKYTKKKYLTWDNEQHIPNSIREYTHNCNLHIKDLLNVETDLCKKAIHCTKTATVLENIKPIDIEKIDYFFN